MSIRAGLIVFALALLIAGTVICLFSSSKNSKAKPVLRIAVASNFSHCLKLFADSFEEEQGTKVEIITGSTGKHYAQIKQGAPFDLFFAADSKRPALLEDEGLTVPGSRQPYAHGRLALWSPQAGLIQDGGDVLSSNSFSHLAIANPLLAPYGLAAEKSLNTLGLWQDVEAKLLRGENVAQAAHFIISGGAELGFVALAQVPSLNATQAEPGSHWLIPRALHQPIIQERVIIHDSPAARLFLDQLSSPQGARLLAEQGYDPAP